MSAADPKIAVDMLMGIGGAAEGIIAACAVKALGGAMLARLAPQSDEEQAAVQAARLDAERALTCDDIVASNQSFFAATGVTDSLLLSGVRYHGRLTETDSLVLRSETHTRRRIQAEHVIDSDAPD